MPHRRLTADQRQRIARLRLMIFDVDGVLTDGRIFFFDGESEIKAFDVKDGHGIKLLLRAGLELALITGRQSRVVERRAADLGIRLVHQKALNKSEALDSILQAAGCNPEQAGYLGDDLIDIPVLRRVGFAAAVADASPHILPYVHYQTQAAGGRGACREICELILQVQGRWAEVTARYFNGGGS